MWQHPILFLSEVPLSDLQKILEFIYCGEVQVQQKRLASFLKSAELLKINGLNDSLRQSRHDRNSDTGNRNCETETLISNRRKKRRKVGVNFLLQNGRIWKEQKQKKATTKSVEIYHIKFLAEPNLPNFSFFISFFCSSKHIFFRILGKLFTPDARSPRRIQFPTILSL